MKIGIIDICNQMKDPRKEGRIIYKMEHIVYIAIAAVICGCQTWNEIEEFGNTKFDFFKQRLPELEKVPSHDTFNRFFSILDPRCFENVFRSWVRQICAKVEGVVAIDGKLMRGPSKCDESHSTGKDEFRLWMVSAWAVSNGISLGQEKVDTKSNEIKAVPKLIGALDLEGCIVTIDAMGCQSSIIEAITEKKGNYVIALKENQKKGYKFAKGTFEDLDNGLPLGGPNVHTSCVTEEKGHGRLEKRSCDVISYANLTSMLDNKFLNLKSIVRIVSERTILNTGETTKEQRYYVTSLPNDNPQKILDSIRQHWGIENNLHWMLDVVFDEDNSRKVKNAARNFSLLTKIALPVIKNDKSVKGSVNLKRLKAGWDDGYLSVLLRANAI